MRLSLIILAMLCQHCLGIAHLEEKSDRILSRKRRFLVPSQTGWSFSTSFSVSFPLQGLDTSFTGSVPFSYKFNLTGLSRKRRSVSTDLDEKFSILRNLETYLPAFIGLPSGSNGHDCILRAICEVARTPMNDDGLFGDLVNVLLSPWKHSRGLMPDETNSDYVAAQLDGQLRQNCTLYHKMCGISLFEHFEDDQEEFSNYLLT